MASIKCTECGYMNEVTGSGPTKCQLPGCNTFLKVPNDRSSRSGPERTTRALSSLRGYNATVITPPVADATGNLLWTGSRPQLGGFSQTVLDDFLDKFYTLQRGLNRQKRLLSKSENGVEKYQCYDCLQYVPLKRHAQGGEAYLSIDHHLSIRQWVMDQVSPAEGVIDGHLWEYYLLEECKRAHVMLENLVGMCQPCNSRKSGTKDLDGEMRRHVKDGCRRCKRPSPY